MESNRANLIRRLIASSAAVVTTVLVCNAVVSLSEPQRTELRAQIAVRQASQVAPIAVAQTAIQVR